MIEKLGGGDCPGRNTVQGFTYWMDGFWKVIGGFFGDRDSVTVESQTFSELGVHYITPEVDCKVKKTWFEVSEPRDKSKWNRANASREGDFLVIKVDVEEAPCTVKWFNIY